MLCVATEVVVDQGVGTATTAFQRPLFWLRLRPFSFSMLALLRLRRVMMCEMVKGMLEAIPPRLRILQELSPSMRLGSKGAWRISMFARIRGKCS